MLIAIDFISTLLAAHSPTILNPVLAVQAAFFIFYLMLEIRKKGMAENGDVKLFFLSSCGIAAAFAVCLLSVEYEDALAFALLIWLFPFLRIILGRLIHYYYKHGVF